MVPIDSHLVFPVLKYPFKLCDNVRSVFEKHIKSHEEIANGFGFMNDYNNYNVSISFDISKSGNVFNLKSKKYYAQIDSFCKR